MADTPEVKVAESNGQEDMFAVILGDDKTANVAVEKAILKDWVSRELGKDKKLFGFVAKGSRAEDLARGGNRINIDKSKQIADDASRVKSVFDTLAGSAGPIATGITDAAVQIAEGGKPDAVRSQLLDTVRAAVSAELGRGPKAKPRAVGTSHQSGTQSSGQRGVADPAEPARQPDIAPPAAEAQQVDAPTVYHGSANIAREGFSGSLRLDVAPDGRPRTIGALIDSLG
ncbi:MAG TPA: hypothetical protein VNJ04_14590, partial [Gemmatimonadaceae bacterium]|nr:hypothetical protein [Gemmatimonadaceae bacterium]